MRQTRILLAEDDREIMTTLVRVLEEAGYQVHSSRNGREAKAQLSQLEVDVLITDMMMPGLDGFPVIEHALTLASRPGIIMITANEGRRHKAYAEMLGADCYLRKPFALDVLLDAVASIVRNNNRARRQKRPKQRPDVAPINTLASRTPPLASLFEGDDFDGTQNKSKSLVPHSAVTFNAAIASLAGSFCHELGNSLQLLALFANREEAGHRDALATLANMTEYVADLHQFVRYFYYSPTEPVATVHADDIEVSIRGMVESMIREANVTFVFSASLRNGTYSIPRVILRHLVVPLLHNSIDAVRGRPENGTVELIVVRSDMDEGTTFIVSDNGPGWPKAPSEMRSLFNGQSRFTTKGVNRGFGLANVSRLLRELGGQLTLDFSDCGGAKATIILSDRHAVSPQLCKLPAGVAGAIAEVVGGFCHRFKNLLQGLLLRMEVDSDWHAAVGMSIQHVDQHRNELHRFVRRFYSVEDQPSLTLDGPQVDELVRSAIPPGLCDPDVQVTSEFRGEGIVIPRAIVICLVVPLLENAAEALDGIADGVVNVTIAHSAASGVITVDVVDNGPGWESDTRHIEELIEHDRVPSRKGLDRGLGLHTLFRLVAKLGGNLVLENVPTGGARVSVSVPLKDIV